MTRSVIWVLVAWFTLAAQVCAQDKPARLSAEDEKYLSGLLGKVVFDPLVDGKPAQRVTFTRVYRSVWGSSGEGPAEGWMIPAKPERIYLLDGESIAAPAANKIAQVDYLAVSKTHFAPEPKPDPNQQKTETRRFGFGAMRRTAAGLADEDLANAAWLHRLGQNELAAEALRRAREDARQDPRELLIDSLAWHYFAELVHAYMVRADEEALHYGEIYLRRYAPTTEEKEKHAKENASERGGRDYPQAAQIVAELKRRQEKGTFGKEPGEGTPTGFNDWEMPKRIAYWIDQLEEVDARQWGQPGGVHLAGDARVEALIALGEPAVPALIDVIEKDKRLTRSVHFWRDFARSRTVLSVREAALTAVMSIIRVRVFAPASTGDNFTARGDSKAEEVVVQLRRYWEENGKIPFAERMMKVLTNPKSSLEANLEAAANIATAGETHPVGTTVFAFGVPNDNVNLDVKKSLDKFTNPTPAEAILALMVREEKNNNPDGANRFLAALVRLQDKRVAPEFVRRSEAATDLTIRRKYAIAAHELGSSEPLTRLASDFAADKIKFPPSSGNRSSDDAGSKELLYLVSAFIDLKSPEAEKALLAVTEPKHSAHKQLGAALLERHHFEFRGLGHHPYCLAILRRMLDDDTDLKGSYKVDAGGSLVVHYPNGMSSGTLPAFLKNAAKRKLEAKLRAYDLAADQLRDRLLGLPLYHPLLTDADERLVKFKNSLDRFGKRVRPAAAWEGEVLGESIWEQPFIIDIPRLDRAATAEDVASGKAIFHLDGRGKLAKVELPMAGTRFSVPGNEEQSPFLILVQAEALPDGEIIYGAIGSDGPLRIAAKDLLSIKTPDQFVADRKTQREGEAKLREQLTPKQAED